MELDGVPENDNQTNVLNYSHVATVLRKYGPLFYLGESKEWVSGPVFTLKHLGKAIGRSASVLRVMLNGSLAIVVVWNDGISVNIQEGCMYAVSYITPIKSAAPVLPVQTFETTFKTDIQQLKQSDSDSTYARRYCSIKELADFKHQMALFYEVDTVGRVGSVSKNSVTITDAENNCIVVEFPSEIKDTGLEPLLFVGSFVGFLNLKVNPVQADQYTFNFCQYSVALDLPGEESKHLIVPLELLRLTGMDLDNYSGFSGAKGTSAGSKSSKGTTYDPDAPLFPSISSPSVIPCSDDDSTSFTNAFEPTTAKRSKMDTPTVVDTLFTSRCQTGIDLTIRKRILNYFTSLGIPVLTTLQLSEARRQGTIVKRWSCVTFEPDHSMGIIAVAKIGGLDYGNMANWRQFYSKGITELLKLFGFRPTFTVDEMTSSVWINFGRDENRMAANIKFVIFGDYCEAEISFFSAIFDCMSIKSVLKSMFLSPTISVRCNVRCGCLCKLVGERGFSAFHLDPNDIIPIECPLVLECSGSRDKSKLSVRVDGIVVQCTMIGAECDIDLELSNALNAYDLLIQPSLCCPLFYCVNCIAKKVDPILRPKLMSFGVIEADDIQSCYSPDCEETTQLYLVTRKI